MNTTLLNEEWVKEEIREEIRKFLETNKNGETTCQNLLDSQAWWRTLVIPVLWEVETRGSGFAASLSSLTVSLFLSLSLSLSVST